AFSLKYLLVFIVALFVAKAIIVLIFNFIRIKIDADYEETTRNELFKSVLRATWPYLLKQKIGYLETVLMTDVLRGAVMLRQIGNMIMVLTGLIIYTFVAFNISPTITLISLTLAGFLFLLFKPLLHRTRTFAARASVANKEVAHYINESIIGMKAIKSMQLHEEVMAKGGNFFQELKKIKTASLILSSLASSIIQPMSLILVVVVFGVAYKMPGFSFAALIAIVYLIQRMFQYIQDLQANLHQASEAVPYLENLLQYQQKANEHKERAGGGGDYQFRNNVTFSNVCFSYQPGRPILSNVIFTVARGEMVGLIGESGSGKTTIVDLLLRLFEPSTGEILLDGKDIRTISVDQWRKNIGYVSQDVFLINDTIANNIKFFDRSITDADVADAAKMANIHEFIRECPDGFDAVVGERGIMLSAGQRQRIAIARVLARKPNLLILDEATSALDNESEAKIQEVIENLRHKITVLVIAHRLSTVMDADKLIVLEKGAIIEEGTPKNLLANPKSYFYKLSNIRK
ncbi:MAG: ABC transporter ATP-binding protein, partial [Parcubacteria group bacterium]|nr:ABC transporter ATP-binding protein [Parcubacteria group bacterium]